MFYTGRDKQKISRTKWASGFPIDKSSGTGNNYIDLVLFMRLLQIDLAGFINLYR